MRAIALLLAFSCLTAGLEGQTDKRLWVLRESNEIVEYDPGSFAAQATVPAPPQAVQYPENLQINALGQMLWNPVFRGRWGEALSPGPTPANLWVWDDGTTKVIPGRTKQSIVRRGDNTHLEDIQSRAVLARDGPGLFWFENGFHRVPDARLTVDRSVGYGNKDYDIGFYTPVAKLSPDLDRVAFTIASTSDPVTEIRLADQGVPDAAALERVRLAAADLPAVEVVRAGEPARPLARIPHARLVGWWNDQQILLHEDRSLVLFDLETGNRIEQEQQALAKDGHRRPLVIPLPANPPRHPRALLAGLAGRSMPLAAGLRPNAPPAT